MQKLNSPSLTRTGGVSNTAWLRPGSPSSTRRSAPVPGSNSCPTSAIAASSARAAYANRCASLSCGWMAVVLVAGDFLHGRVCTACPFRANACLLLLSACARAIAASPAGSSPTKSFRLQSQYPRQDSSTCSDSAWFSAGTLSSANTSCWSRGERKKDKPMDESRRSICGTRI